MFVPPLMTLLRGPQPFFSDKSSGGGGWSQEIGPSAQYFSALGKTIVSWYVTGVTGYKSAAIAAYDHATGAWSPRYICGNYLLADDDHGRTAICQDASGYFHIFFGSHDNEQGWSSSNSPNDITSWTQHASLSTQQTYPHPQVIGSVIYLLVRNGNAFPNNAPMALRTCTPVAGVGTFSAQANIIDFNDGSGGRVYTAECYVSGTDIHFVATRANSTDTLRRGLYYFRYDTATGALKNHDASVSTASGSLPINLTLANSSYRIFDHGSGQGDTPSFCLDAAGDPHIVFTDDNAVGGTSYEIKYMTRVAGVWSTPTVLATITDLFSGLAFNSFYTILPGTSGGVEFWFMATGGNKMRRIRSSGGVWSPAETIQAANPTMLLGSGYVRNAHADLRYLFAESAPLPTLDSGAIVVKRFAYGDGGAIDAAIPTTPADANFANVTLLLGFDHRDAATTIINEAPNAFTGATFSGNAQIDTAQSKFGGASLLLDGTGDFVSIPNNSQYSVSQGDFTVECFVRRNASKQQTILSKRPPTGSSEWVLYAMNTTNALRLTVFNVSTFVLNLDGTTALSSGVWHHVAFSRQGTTWRLFLDGALEASGTESGPPLANSNVLNIGRDTSATSARDFNGHIDEVRITSGVARYTAAFTAPSAAFPRI